jgi:predicted ABC-type transport system involved in lysophospholipase L1 biosynthesis ATPase subunit
MRIGGVAVMEGARPVALINGDSIVAGDYLDRAGELFVSDIRSHEIEFIFQGVTLIRRIDDGTPLGSTRN